MPWTRFCSSTPDHLHRKLLFNALPTWWNKVARSKKTLQFMWASQRVRRALTQREQFGCTALKYSEEFMLYTFARKDAFKEESVRRLWNLILNSAGSSMEKTDTDWKIARYTSSNHFLTSYMQMGESGVQFARKWAALDVWNGIIGAIMAWSITGDEELYLPTTGRRYMPAGRNVPDQTRQKDFEVREGRSPGAYVLVPGLKLYVS